MSEQRALSSPLSRREQAIVRLLETSTNELPQPTPQSTVASGFVHKARSRACPDCLANGQVMPRCETCFGRGHIDPLYAKNVAATDTLIDDDDRRDPYAVNEKTLRYGLDGSRHDAAHARDREIEMLGRQTRPARSESELLAEANESPFGWERAREQMRKRFDYVAVDLVMEELRLADHPAYRALHAVYVYAWMPCEGLAADACRRGLRFLSPRLAVVELVRKQPLRAPDVPPPAVNFAARGRGADPRALEQRNAGILFALAEGDTKEDVARLFGLSISQLNRILASVERAAA